MNKAKWIVVFCCLVVIACGSGGGSSAAPAAKHSPVSGTGWYFGLQPPHGEAFWVGPYPDDATCADMYGSCIYAHPFACHNTGLPQDCGVIGNGFCYPQSYPYPVPANEIIAGNLNCEQLPNAGRALRKGWYFAFYTLTGGSVIGAKTVGECTNLYAQYKAMAEITPGDEIGFYSDAQCPGAPCFSVGEDTACE